MVAQCPKFVSLTHVPLPGLPLRSVLHIRLIQNFKLFHFFLKNSQIELLLSVFSGAQNLILFLSVPEHIDGHVGRSADHHHMRKLQLLHLLWNALQEAKLTRQQRNKIKISPGCGIVHHSQPLHSRGHCWQPQPAESIRNHE